MRTTVATLPNNNKKLRENSLKKKILPIFLFLILLTFLIFAGINIYEYLTAPKWTIDQYGAIAQFLDYDVPFDGKANLPNYADYEINFDDVLNESADVYLNDMKKFYVISGEPIYNKVIDENSIVSLTVTRLIDGKFYDKMDYTLSFDKVIIGLPFMNEIKSIIGQTDGYSLSFVLDGIDDNLLYKEYADSKITYNCIVNHCLSEDIYPNITDEFVYDLTGFENLEIFKEAYAKEMYNKIISDSDMFYEIFSNKILDNIIRDLDVTKVSTPTLEEAFKASLEILIATANSMGMDPEIYAQNIYGMDSYSYAMEYGKRFGDLHTTLILIAEQEGLDVSDEAFELYLNDIASNAGFQNKDEMIENYGPFYNEMATKHDFIMEVLARYLINEKKIKFVDSKFTKELYNTEE